MHIHVYLLASILYLHVSLFRFRLCLALCLPWACACVVTTVPSRVCLGVTTCEIHPHGVGVTSSHPSPLCAMLIYLPCLLCATCLAFFASLHLCTFSYIFMHESLLACVIKPNTYYLVRVHTRLSYTRPRVPYRNFF